MSSGVYLIYGLTDPRTGECRYVGKSTIGMIRPRHHGLECFLNRPAGGRHKKAWIRKLQRLGMTYGTEVLYSSPTLVGLDEAERFWIAEMRQRGHRLTNCTDGGEGAPGYRHTDECKQRMSALKKGKPSPKKGRGSLARDAELEMVRMYEEGLSTTAISERLEGKMGVGGIRKVLLRHGVTMRTAAAGRWLTERGSR